MTEHRKTEEPRGRGRNTKVPMFSLCDGHRRYRRDHATTLTKVMAKTYFVTDLDQNHPFSDLLHQCCIPEEVAADTKHHLSTKIKVGREGCHT